MRGCRSGAGRHELDKNISEKNEWTQLQRNQILPGEWSERLDAFINIKQIKVTLTKKSKRFNCLLRAYRRWVSLLCVRVYKYSSSICVSQLISERDVPIAAYCTTVTVQPIVNCCKKHHHPERKNVRRTPHRQRGNGDGTKNTRKKRHLQIKKRKKRKKHV